MVVNGSARRTMHEENKANLATLGERVDGMGKTIGGLEADVQQLGLRLDNGLNAIRKDVNSQLSTLADNFSTSMAGISDKIDKRDDRRWLWPVVVGASAVVLSAVVAVGSLSLGPVREDVAELKRTLREEKAERKDGDRDLIERDRRLWDHAIRMRSEFDFLRGQLSAKP